MHRANQAMAPSLVLHSWPVSWIHGFLCGVAMMLLLRESVIGDDAAPVDAGAAVTDIRREKREIQEYLDIARVSGKEHNRLLWQSVAPKIMKGLEPILANVFTRPSGADETRIGGDWWRPKKELFAASIYAKVKEDAALFDLVRQFTVLASGDWHTGILRLDLGRAHDSRTFVGRLKEEMSLRDMLESMGPPACFVRQPNGTESGTIWQYHYRTTDNRTIVVTLVDGLVDSWGLDDKPVAKDYPEQDMWFFDTFVLPWLEKTTAAAKVLRMHKRSIEKAIGERDEHALARSLDALMVTKDYLACIRLADRGLKVLPDSLRLNLAMGICQQAAGNTDRAIGYLEKVVALGEGHGSKEAARARALLKALSAEGEK